MWPFPGHLHPNMAVAHALCKREHEVAFYTGGTARSSLESQGLSCFQFRRVEEPRVESIVLALDALSLQWWRAGQSKALLREWLLGTVEAQLEDLTEVLPLWWPDVIVTDPAMWGPLLVFRERTQIPLAVMSYVAACMLPGPDAPILGLPLPRARGPFSRSSHRVLRSLMELASADMRRTANQLRARYSLPPIDTTVTAFTGQVPLYLVPSTPAFDRQRADLPKSVQYVGPCHWDPPGDNSSASWVADLPRDCAVVYVTEGTLHSKPPFLLRAALQGLSSLPVRVIATTGRHRDPAELGLGPIPSNARVERWVPHGELLPRTQVVITTGGTGTVLGSLSAGVPLVVAPAAWDQPENAWRVAEAGAGIRLAPRQCTPERIRHAVQRILTEHAFRQNARRLAADFSGYRGATQAAILLEDFALQQRNLLQTRARGVAPPFSGGTVRPPAINAKITALRTRVNGASR